jgi:hypothetical protein
MARQTTSNMKYRTLSTYLGANIFEHLEAITSSLINLGDIEVHELKTSQDISGQYYTTLAFTPQEEKEVEV